jgi:hypothetical protein
VQLVVRHPGAGADELEQRGERGLERRLVAGGDRLLQVAVDRVQRVELLVGEAVLALTHDANDHRTSPS